MNCASTSPRSSFYVSDRRWVKIVWLLRVAAASEGRAAVALWDLLLLPWLTAFDAARQTTVADWLATRLGVREAFSPTRLTRVIEAFEAQLDAELKANDLDYDESGRLQFSSTDLAAIIGDAKGGAAAPRMKYSRARRYGETHIGARVSQIDSLILRIADYANEIAAHRESLAAYRAQSLWLDEGLTESGRSESGRHCGSHRQPRRAGWLRSCGLPGTATADRRQQRAAGTRCARIA